MRKKLLSLLLFSVAVCILASCSKDEEDGLISSSQFQNSKFEVYKRECYLNGKITTDRYNFKPFYWSIETDRSCNGGNWTGEWEIKGNTILIHEFWSGYSETSKLQIIESKMGENGKDGWSFIVKEEYDDTEYDYELYYIRYISSIE